MNEYGLMKSSNGISSVSLDARLMENRILYIDDQEISGAVISNLVKRILVLVMENAEKPITILMDSPGGEVNAGMVLYDVLQTCSTPIRLVVTGKAFSMAAVLFAAGRHGRYMLENSKVMLHQPLLGRPITGDVSSIRSVSDSLLQTRDKISDLLARHTGKTVQEINEATGYDHYFNAQEAIEFGMCDGVIRFDEILEGENGI